MRWTIWKRTVMAAVVMLVTTVAAMPRPATANSGNCGGSYGCPGR